MGPQDGRELAARVDAFRGRRVAVLGDLVADEFIYGDITRVSREAPVLVLTHDRTVFVPGGGANSVANLRALGAHPLPVGAVGRDEAGRGLLAALRRLRIDTSGIVVLSGYRTPVKSRILAGGIHTRRQQIVRLDTGSPKGELPRAARARLRRALRDALRSTEGLLIADYGFGSAAPDVAQPLIASLVKRGVPVTVDSTARLLEYPGVDACTPNQEELEQALGTGPLAEQALDAAGRRLLRRSCNAAALVTRGARGMTLFEHRRPPLHVPAYGTDEVADVTGAGDTVAAVFTLALIAGASKVEAARIANCAAGIVVTKVGTATVSHPELRRAILAGASS